MDVRVIENNDFAKGRQSHPFCSFVYLTAGDLVVESASRLYQCSAGHILFVPQGVSYSIRHANGVQGVEAGFLPEQLRDASFPILYGKTAVQHAFWFQDAAFIGALMARLAEASAENRLRLLQSGIDLILCMMKGNADGVESLSDRFLQLVFDHSGPIAGVSDYAAKLGVSSGSLNKAVRTKTFKSPVDWIEISRLNKAKDLLRGSRQSMAEISRAVGIDDQSYFARFFKKLTGQTPREYREGGSSRD